jgi:hypothetical protein
MMRQRTATIGSVNSPTYKKRSAPGMSVEAASEATEATGRKSNSLFDSFRPRSKSDATRKPNIFSHHRRVPMVLTLTKV